MAFLAVKFFKIAKFVCWRIKEKVYNLGCYSIKN